MALTARQELFAIEYLKDLNGTQAALRAGYSATSAAESACENLSNSNIQALIAEAAEKRNQRVEIAGDFVLTELHALADADVSAIFNEDGTLKPVHEMPVRVRKSIAAIEVEEIFEGTGKDRTWIGNLRKIKFWSKDKALELLARHKALLNDKVSHEHTGADGGPIIIDDYTRMARIEAIFEAAARIRANDGSDLV